MYPGGGALPVRAWPLNYYSQTASALIQDGYTIGVIGLPTDMSISQQLVTANASPWCVNLAGYTHNVRELLLLFQRTKLLITNDGGPGQFAALTTMPSIVLFGPETPKLYAPLAQNVHPLFVQLACSPCLTAYNHRNSPCDGNNHCLQQIQPAQVISLARGLLQTQ